MKKKLALFLVLMFIFTNMIPVMALDNTGISQEKAIQKVKNIFDTISFDRFNINYNENYDGKKVWELYWNETKEPYGSLHVNIDADDGNILNIYLYRGYNPDRKTSPIPKYNKDQAQKIAEAFAKKLQPQEFAKTKLYDREQEDYPMEDTSYSDAYRFNFIRMENNIPVEYNGFNITVDAHTGEVESYDFNWSWDPLPSAEKIISLKEAEKIFQDNLGLKLVYQRYFDYRTREENIKLIYTLDYPREVLIDAITGKLIKNDYYGISEKAAMGSKQMADGGFTPAEQKEVEITKNCISKETAIEEIKKYILILDGFKVNYANLYEDYNDPDQKVWSINWKKSDDNGVKGYIYTRVNAITSEVLSFDFYSYDEPSQKFKQNYDRASAQRKAEEFLKKFQPDRFTNVKLQETDEEIEFPEKVKQHHFGYTRLVGDIPYPNNGFNLTVDAQSGVVTSYRLLWHEREFPSADGVLTKADAEERFLKNIGLELAYVSIFKPKEETRNYQLVYRVKTSKSYNFDAFEFKPLDYSGKPIEEEIKTAFADIKGHWAEKDIQLLVDLGVIKSAEDKFRPDENITEGDFIKLLMIAKNQRISDDIPIPVIKLESEDLKSDEEIQRYIDAALKLGWVKPGEADVKRLLSREKAAAFVVRAMGFDKVASLSGIYKDAVKDVASIKPEYKGHISIAMGLQLLSEDDGNFKPKSTTSRAQATTILVRMLKSDDN